jgi:hypothetical protein
MTPPAQVTRLRLDQAMLCLSCACVFQLGAPACPACASPHFRPLATWVDRGKK